LKSDANNTLNKKPIYKELYDYSDIEKNFEKFLQKRRNDLINSKSFKSYGAFNKEQENSINSRNNFCSIYNRNNYSSVDYINRTNNNIKKSNSCRINDMKNIIDKKIKHNKMDKNKFFGFSYLIKK
jgi:hypothetical protein